MAAVLALATGCTALAVGGSASYPSGGTAAGDDGRITATVRGQLSRSELVDVRRVYVVTRDGVVTLEGRVGTAEGREQAGQLAAETGGVRQVINKLEVVPTGG